jgi:hypothetical protein
MVVSRQNRAKYKNTGTLCIKCRSFVLKLAVHTITTKFQRANTITLTTQIVQQAYIYIYFFFFFLALQPIVGLYFAAL